MNGLVYTGTGWYPDSPKADEDKITKAIIRKDGKEIAIDYEYHNEKLYIKLTSENGIDFKGEYGKFGKKIGTCDFTFSKNLSGECFLLGGYSGDPVDDNGSWHIKLKPQKQ